MNLRHLAATLLAALLLIAAACGGDEDDGGANIPPPATPTPVPTGPEEYPLTVTDDHGQDITLESAPQRVVALAPSFVEVLYAIGAGSTIVAADENTDFPPEAAGIPKISGFEPSFEAITSYDPDLILLTYDPGGLQHTLQQLGTPVLFLASPESIEDTLEQIETLGRAVGKGVEARELVATMESDIAGLEAKLPEGDGPRIFHELDNTFYAAGPGSFIDDLYARLGAQNIAEDTDEPYPQMSAEAIIAADPEVIILADEQAGESPQTVAARPGWDATSAVKNARVHVVDPNLVSRPGPRLVEALEALGAYLYPEQFP